jgi:P2-related tail formation protein
VIDQLLHDWKFIVFAATLIFNAGIMVATVGYLRIMVNQLRDLVKEMKGKQEHQEERLIKLEAEHRVFHRAQRVETKA